MKITRSELKKIIAEEIEKIDPGKAEMLHEFETDLATTAGSAGKQAKAKLGSMGVFATLRKKLSTLQGPKKADALVSLLLNLVSKDELVGVVAHLKTKLGSVGRELPEPGPESPPTPKAPELEPETV